LHVALVRSNTGLTDVHELDSLSSTAPNAAALPPNRTPTKFNLAKRMMELPSLLPESSFAGEEVGLAVVEGLVVIGFGESHARRCSREWLG